MTDRIDKYLPTDPIPLDGEPLATKYPFHLVERPPYELGWIAGLDNLDPRVCPFEKMTKEWREWQRAHGKAVEYIRDRFPQPGGE